jgi:hypothetical protein
MAIIEAVPPDASVRALAAAMPRLTAPSLARLRQLPVERRTLARLPTESAAVAMAPPAISPAYAHPVYVLLLPDILAGRGLAAARLVSWRYLLMEGARSVASAEVNTDENHSHHSFATMHPGEANQATLQAIAQMQDSPTAAAGDFELRLLRIPALTTVALWLYSPTENGALIAIPPANPHFAQSQLYSQAEWETAMLAAAGAAEDDARRDGFRPGPRPRL